MTIGLENALDIVLLIAAIGLTIALVKFRKEMRAMFKRQNEEKDDE